MHNHLHQIKHSTIKKFGHKSYSGKEKLCLFGFPNETWEVKPTDDTVPPNVPKPIIGINFARDKMQEKEWLSKVALLSDVWLLSLAFCCAATFKFGKSERNRLFQMINDLPTIVEAMIEDVEPAKDMAASAYDNSSKSRSRGKTEGLIIITRLRPLYSKGRP